MQTFQPFTQCMNVLKYHTSYGDATRISSLYFCLCGKYLAQHISSSGACFRYKSAGGTNIDSPFAYTNTWTYIMREHCMYLGIRKKVVWLCRNTKSFIFGEDLPCRLVADQKSEVWTLPANRSLYSVTAT